ncbi:unnamed protein product [Ambrosiozyma monospora]|uniref:Unnamed protein product n=1 Tax=Ambrosiozyma monospora TaxID=43982 RepID=A0ACB5SYX7_AMBMO|nr:unnamed protein product [Ambrosiozyma monospora]
MSKKKSFRGKGFRRGGPFHGPPPGYFSAPINPNMIPVSRPAPGHGPNRVHAPGYGLSHGANRQPLPHPRVPVHSQSARPASSSNPHSMRLVPEVRLTPKPRNATAPIRPAPSPITQPSPSRPDPPRTPRATPTGPSSGRRPPNHWNDAPDKRGLPPFNRLQKPSGPGNKTPLIRDTKSIRPPNTPTEISIASQSLLTPVSRSSVDTLLPRHIEKKYDYTLFEEQNHSLRKVKQYRNTAKPIKTSKISYDPEMKKDPAKGSRPIYEAIRISQKPVKDPRESSNPHFEKAMSRSYRKPSSGYYPIKYKYDKYSLGPEPSAEIVIWNISPTTSAMSIKNHYAVFGAIKSLKMVDDPNTAVPLGMCLLKFDGEIEPAHKCALKAVSETHKKLSIGSHIASCGLNTDNDLYDGILNKILEMKKEGERKEEERREERRKMAAVEEERKRVAELRAYKKQKRRFTSSPPPPPPPQVANGMPLLPEILGPKENIPTVRLNSHDLHVVPASKCKIPPDLVGIIGNNPFILIPDKYLSTRNINVENVRWFLKNYNFTRILVSMDIGFFILFKNLADAQRCYDVEDGRSFSKYRVYMTFYVPDELMSQTGIEDKIGIVGQAKIQGTG